MLMRYKMALNEMRRHPMTIIIMYYANCINIFNYLNEQIPLRASFIQSDDGDL